MFGAKKINLRKEYCVEMNPMPPCISLSTLGRYIETRRQQPTMSIQPSNQGENKSLSSESKPMENKLTEDKGRS